MGSLHLTPDKPKSRVHEARGDDVHHGKKLEALGGGDMCLLYFFSE